MLRKSEKKGLVQWHYLRQTLCCFLLEKPNQLIFSISLQKNEALVVVEPTMNNVELVAH